MPESARKLFDLHPFSEAEMWMDTLASFFKHHNLRFVAPTKVVALDQDFCDQLRLAAYVIGQIDRLVAGMVVDELRQNAAQAENAAVFDPALQNSDLSQIKSRSLVINRLAVFLDSVRDVKLLADELLRGNRTSFQIFRSLGRILNKEFLALKKNRQVVRLRQLHSDSRFEEVIHRDILAPITNKQMRLEVTELLMGFLKLLNYLQFVADQLKRSYNFRALLLIFSLLHWELQALARRIESTLSEWQRRGQAVEAQFQTSLFALRIESRRVFDRELSGIEQMTQIEAIYAKLEDSCYLLRNCLQSSFIQLSRALNPGFREHTIFEDIARRYEETICLLADMQTIESFVSLLAKNPTAETHRRLVHIVQVFRETSMRYLMFRDWAAFESFIEEFSTRKDAESLRFTLHKFSVFIDTMVGEVSKRAVLRTAETA